MDLTTKYLGLELPHPLMPGASPLAHDLDTIRHLEDAGAAAIIMHSLFEEQLVGEQIESFHATDLYAEGIYAVGFFFPVVPQGQARIRTQLSAAHEKHHLDKAIAAFRKVGEKYGILGLDKKELIEKFGM